MRTILIIILIFLSFCKEKNSTYNSNEKEEAQDFSYSFSDSNELPQTTNQFLNRKNLKGKYSRELKPPFDQSVRNIKELIKNNKFNEAEVEIKKTLASVYNSELFFLYGEILFQLKKLNDALIAFQISREHDMQSQPEFTFYRISCIYSLLGKIPESFDYLERAIDRGYNNKSQIESDSNLSNLRMSNLWKKKESYIYSKILNFTNESLVGALNYYGPSWGSATLLCKNEKSYSMDWCQEKKELLIGTWKIEDNSLHFQWKSKCEAIGIGNPVEESECGNIYKEYLFKGCTDISETKLNGIISKSELALAFGREYKGMEGGEMEYRYVYKNLKVQPVQCKSDFYPKSTQDIEILKGAEY